MNCKYTLTVSVIVLLTASSCKKNAGSSSPTSAGSAAKFKISFIQQPGKIWITNEDGASLYELNGDQELEMSQSWSPDGQLITFLAQSTVATGSCNAYQVYSVRYDGTLKTYLGLDSCANSYSPTWSPDGSQIAFDEEGLGIYVMSSDGSSKTKITPQGMTASSPAWNPKSAIIAFRGNTRS